MLPKFIAVFLIVLLFSLPVSAKNERGSITSLNASGGANPDEIITISIMLQTNGKIQNSNLRYYIIAPSGVVVDSATVGVPSMNKDTFSHSWTSNNSNYPDMGNYTVQACWSPGNSSNCGLASASVTFYSADTLGPLLMVVIVVFGGWIWKQRHDF
jgi:hypothetical protein